MSSGFSNDIVPANVSCVNGLFVDMILVTNVRWSVQGTLKSQSATQMSDLNNISQADDTRERSQELLPFANSVLSAKGMFTVAK